MNIKKPLLIAGITSSVALASIVGAGAASAETTSTNGPDGLIQKIAQKFNLKEAEVKAVFEEQKTVREAEHQKSFEERLTKAVTDGKITEEQKEKIVAKVAELKAERGANRDTMKDKTDAERRTAMEARRAELEKWAKDNNVPIEYLHPGGGMHGPGGHGPRIQR
jgi:glycine cleavage system pyridoxal-binding protein P